MIYEMLRALRFILKQYNSYANEIQKQKKKEFKFVL